VGEGHKPEDPRERCRGVGRRHSTNEVLEQGRDGKPTRTSAESMEGRPSPKRNANSYHTHRSQNRTEGVPRTSCRGGLNNAPPILTGRAVCTKVCLYGSVRGARSNPRPYRNKRRAEIGNLKSELEKQKPNLPTRKSREGKRSKPLTSRSRDHEGKAKKIFAA